MLQFLLIAAAIMVGLMVLSQPFAGTISLVLFIIEWLFYLALAIPVVFVIPIFCFVQQANHMKRGHKWLFSFEGELSDRYIHRSVVGMVVFASVPVVLALTSTAFKLSNFEIVMMFSMYASTCVLFVSQVGLWFISRHSRNPDFLWALEVGFKKTFLKVLTGEITTKSVRQKETKNKQTNEAEHRQNRPAIEIEEDDYEKQGEEERGEKFEAIRKRLKAKYPDPVLQKSIDIMVDENIPELVDVGITSTNVEATVALMKENVHDDMLFDPVWFDKFEAGIDGVMSLFVPPSGQDGIFTVTKYVNFKEEVFSKLINHSEVLQKSYYRLRDGAKFDEYPFSEIKALEYKVGTKDREMHTMLVGKSGSGKSQLIKLLIKHNLEEDCCIIVIDSQIKLIRELAQLDIKMEDVTWISPEHDVALNLFDYDEKDLKDEATQRHLLDLLYFTLDSILDNPLTSRQRTVFSRICKLVIAIPGGNIQTFFNILTDHTLYSQWFGKLSKRDQEFFEKRFASELKDVQEQIKWRIDALLESTTMERLFSTRENRVNMFNEMARAKLVLIDTNNNLLGEWSSFFGRLFIAQILHACRLRVDRNEMMRPVYVYIDESYEYFNEHIATMLFQARKANVGLILSLTELSQSDGRIPGKKRAANITSAMFSNTTTKIVGDVSHNDAVRLAKEMDTTAEYIKDVGTYYFTFYHPSHGSLDITGSAEPFADFPKRKNLDDLRAAMEAEYGRSRENPYVEKSIDEAEEEPKPEVSKSKKETPKKRKKPPKPSDDF